MIWLGQFFKKMQTERHVKNNISRWSIWTTQKDNFFKPLIVSERKGSMKTAATVKTCMYN